MLSIQGKFKEAIISILPIFIVIMLLNYTLIPLSESLIIKFTVGTVLMIIGMPLFLLGIDISITPIGEQLSEALTGTNKLWIILLGGGLLGFIVTVAEPDLHILAGQVSAVTLGHFDSRLMVVLVSLGVGVMISLGIFRIIKNIVLRRFVTFIYLLILILGVFTKPDFLAIAFDASGSTTGSVSVPFILALAAGISAMTRSNEKEENDGFGMLGVASTGAIIAVMLQGIFTKGSTHLGSLPESAHVQGRLVYEILSEIGQNAKGTLTVLLPVIIIYFTVNLFFIKTPPGKNKRILTGCFYTYIGLVLFLTGVNLGLFETCSQAGYRLAALDKPWLLITVGAVFGIITIPAEPSVHILTSQIEDETAGSIKSSLVMIALCFGVALAVGLSILRIIVPALMMWHILLPGMIIAIVLSYLVPDIFVGIAFDSGGVAAGTMTAAFILPFAHGAAEFFPTASVVLDGFGLIALVAMTPIITVQLLGLIYKIKTHALLNEESDED